MLAFHLPTTVDKEPEFREHLDLSPTYQCRHISGNIIPKITKDMSKHYRNFQVISNREGSQRILGYTLTW